jgi:hypothetical protein
LALNAHGIMSILMLFDGKPTPLYSLSTLSKGLCASMNIFVVLSRALTSFLYEVCERSYTRQFMARCM